MCDELKLIQTHLGIWKLEDWDITTCAVQLNKPETLYGIYIIKCNKNNMMLIGEGKLCGNRSRLTKHLAGNGGNSKFNKDLHKYGTQSFVLYGFIPEKDEIKRKLIENKLQLYFIDKCYNTPRKEYPTQQQILNYSSVRYGYLKDRLSNYTKIQKVQGFDKCWESNYAIGTSGYSLIRYKKYYSHHVLMYILYYGDICGISSVIHHKCENKRCVNPKHLEVTTNTQNLRYLHNCDEVKSKIEKLYQLGYSKANIGSLLQLSRGTVYRYTDCSKMSQYYGVNKARNKWKALIFLNNKSINLGTYNTEIEAAQNRDFYIVRYNLCNKKQSTLNFHTIDYNNFTPYLKNKNK